MKTWHWVVILVVVAIVIIGIVLFICDSFPHSFFSGGKCRTVNQYEIFRDLLAIVLTLAGLSIALLGTGVYKWISKDLNIKAEEHIAGLDAEIKRKVDEEVNYAMAVFFLELSYDCWEAYEVKDELQQYKENQLERAVALSKKALKRAKRLDMEQKEFKRILCEIKNSLAYHLAVRGYIKDAEDAISLTKYAYKRVQDFDFKRTCNWTETYAFVLIKMGTAEQKEEGREVLRELRDHAYLPKPLRDSIDRKYTKRLALKAEWKKIRKD